MFEIKKDLLSPETLKQIKENISTDIFPWYYKKALTHGKKRYVINFNYF